MFLCICSHNPAHSRASPEASEGGAGCGARAPVPRKHGAPGGTGLAPGALRPSRDPFATVMIATPSANAGNARSAEARPGDRKPPRGAPMGAASLRQRGAHARQGVHTAGGANRRSAPRSSRANTRRATVGDRDGHPRGRPKAAADFAWLFDNVNRILNRCARLRVRSQSRDARHAALHPRPCEGEGRAPSVSEAARCGCRCSERTIAPHPGCAVFVARRPSRSQRGGEGVAPTSQ